MPPLPCQVASLVDKAFACSLDYAGSYEIPRLPELVVLHPFPMVPEVAQRRIDGLASLVSDRQLLKVRDHAVHAPFLQHPASLLKQR